MLLNLSVAYVGQRVILEKSCGSYSKDTWRIVKIDCGLFAHTDFQRDNSEWQNVTDLSSKSCFEILHSKICAGLWMRTGKKK